MALRQDRVPRHLLLRIEFVRKFIKENAIHSVVDLGCGDWQFSPYIYHDRGVAYTGYDVVLPVIQESLGSPPSDWVYGCSSMDLYGSPTCASVSFETYYKNL
jgi:SAM-dependent methyltransferase